MGGDHASHLDYIVSHKGLASGDLNLCHAQLGSDLDEMTYLTGRHLCSWVVLPLAVAEETRKVTPLGDADA